MHRFHPRNRISSYLRRQHSEPTAPQGFIILASPALSTLGVQLALWQINLYLQAYQAAEAALQSSPIEEEILGMWN
jgi:hypothetical protein